MAGYREFQTGEVLTAANVNDFLMNQSVMKFADAAARDTALGTAVGGSNALREGMVAYLDSTDEIQVYDGTSWGGVGLPLGTATPTDGQILAFGTATSTWNPTNQLAGIGSNVVQTVKTDTFSTTSATFVDVTGLTATITPTSATSKILIIAQVAASVSSGNNVNAIFALGGGNAATYVGDASGALVRAVTSLHNDSRGTVLSYDRYQSLETIEMVYLDSPATTSPVTYAVQTRVTTGTSFVNQEGADAFVRGASSITAIEVSA